MINRLNKDLLLPYNGVIVSYLSSNRKKIQRGESKSDTFPQNQNSGDIWRENCHLMQIRPEPRETPEEGHIVIHQQCWKFLQRWKTKSHPLLPQAHIYHKHHDHQKQWQKMLTGKWINKDSSSTVLSKPEIAMWSERSLLQPLSRNGLPSSDTFLSKV